MLRTAERLAPTLATWFGCGRLPRAPGTWGSLAALPLAWLIAWLWGPWALVATAALLFAVGVWAAGVYARANGQADPQAVVIDEVVGQCLTLVVAPLHPLAYLIGFALFRLFDIAKPWPVSWADRSVGGGLGIMLDDVLAGLYGAAALWAFTRWGAPLFLGG